MTPDSTARSSNGADPHAGPRILEDEDEYDLFRSRYRDLFPEKFDNRVNRLPAIFLENDHVRTLTAGTAASTKRG